MWHRTQKYKKQLSAEKKLGRGHKQHFQVGKEDLNLVLGKRL